MNDTQPIATVWLCLPCSVRADNDPYTISGATLTGVMFATANWEACGLCGSTALGYRKQYTLWGN